jgi:glycerol-3-phosphate dehydrogenase (NAD(P)+)
MAAAKRHLSREAIVVSAAKGIEEGSSRRMSQVIQEASGCGDRVSVLSGPSFAREVAAEMPTVVTAAAPSSETARHVQRSFASLLFRVYASEDLIGVEIGGSVKNVIAIAAGVADGLGLGHNTRAAIITRGLAEVNRLAIQLGADPRTVTGLAGMGDLVLTCTGELSRNRSLGIKLGQGQKLSDVLAGMTQVAEGVRNTPSTLELARSVGVEMPITTEMHALLFEGKPAREAMVDLMSRRLKHEF